MYTIVATKEGKTLFTAGTFTNLISLEQWARTIEPDDDEVLYAIYEGPKYIGFLQASYDGLVAVDDEENFLIKEE